MSQYGSDPYHLNHMHYTNLLLGTPGTRIKAKVIVMDLPYSSQFDCYHWLEFKDNLIGQSGKE